MRQAFTIAFFLTVSELAGYGQSGKTFEAAIVRPSGPDTPFESKVLATQFIARRHTLRMLVESSYSDLKSWQISGGPSWANADLWDLVAKLPSGVTAEQEPLWRATEEMLRTFLAQEFSLKTHLEPREQPVYELVVAKGGPKFKPTEATEISFRYTPTGFRIQHETMQEFAGTLYCPNCGRQLADRPVIDKTGLTGLYDFILNWAPPNVQAADPAAAGPSVFTALEEQLGLKLQPAKAPVRFLIIDSAEKPAQN